MFKVIYLESKPFFDWKTRVSICELRLFGFAVAGIGFSFEGDLAISRSLARRDMLRRLPRFRQWSRVNAERDKLWGIS